MSLGSGFMARWARNALPIGVVGAVVSAAVTASTYLPGAPFVPPGVAVLLFLGVFPLHASLLGPGGATEHGELTEISEDAYDERRAGESRLFAAIPGCFYVVGAAAGFLARSEVVATAQADWVGGR